MDPLQEQIGKDVPNRLPERRYPGAGLLVMVLMLAFLGLTFFALTSVWPVLQIVSPPSTTIDIEQQK